jgi:hypothetical protein
LSPSSFDAQRVGLGLAELSVDATFNPASRPNSTGEEHDDGRSTKQPHTGDGCER